MTTLDSIHQYAEKLPEALQQEVLEFIRFLLFKQEQEMEPEQEETEWSDFFLASATGDKEAEDNPTYTKERF